MDSIPGQGAKIPHASQQKDQNRSNIITNLIKTRKMILIKKKISLKRKSQDKRKIQEIHLKLSPFKSSIAAKRKLYYQDNSWIFEASCCLTLLKT